MVATPVTPIPAQDGTRRTLLVRRDLPLLDGATSLGASAKQWHVLTLAFLLLLPAVSGGCAGYSVGARSLYPQQVRTIYVPMFQSDSFRRYTGEELTEAVTKRIGSKSSLQLAPATEADSYLNVRIYSEQKRILAENRNDEPRNLEVSYFARVHWVDRQGRSLRDPLTLPVAPLLLSISQQSHFIPEAGQSYATARQQAIDRLAEQIVNQLEAPW